MNRYVYRTLLQTSLNLWISFLLSSIASLGVQRALWELRLCLFESSLKSPSSNLTTKALVDNLVKTWKLIEYSCFFQQLYPNHLTAGCSLLILNILPCFYKTSNHNLHAVVPGLWVHQWFEYNNDLWDHTHTHIYVCVCVCTCIINPCLYQYALLIIICKHTQMITYS